MILILEIEYECGYREYVDSDLYVAVATGEIKKLRCPECKEVESVVTL